MPDLNIREAIPADAQSMADCINSAYSVFKSKIPDLPDVSDGLLTAIEEKSVWIVEKAGAVAGVIVLNPIDNYLILENVAVHRTASGSGIGRALIQKAESECQRLGLREIRLSTHKEMPENISLYEYLGWSIVSVEDNKVHMSKRINWIE